MKRTRRSGSVIHADIQSTPHSETLRDTLGHSWNPQGHSWNPQSVLLKYKHIVEERVSFIFCIVSVIENCSSRAETRPASF